jgi:hypothetical protein
MRLSLVDRMCREWDVAVIADILRQIEQQVNDLADGRISARDGAMTAAPTAGNYVKGDFVWNSNPSEAGGAGSKYVLLGWVCVTSGTPGTWKECRTLTGA